MELAQHTVDGGEKEIWCVCVRTYVHAFSLAPFGVLVIAVDPSPARTFSDCRQTDRTMVIVLQSLKAIPLHSSQEGQSPLTSVY